MEKSNYQQLGDLAKDFFNEQRMNQARNSALNTMYNSICSIAEAVAQSLWSFSYLSGKLYCNAKINGTPQSSPIIFQYQEDPTAPIQYRIIFQPTENGRVECTLDYAHALGSTEYHLGYIENPKDFTDEKFYEIIKLALLKVKEESYIFDK